MAKPIIPSKDGKVWVKINEKWKEGAIAVEVKGMTEWVME